MTTYLKIFHKVLTTKLVLDTKKVDYEVCMMKGLIDGKRSWQCKILLILWTVGDR